jgi:hypothetical protein
VRCAILDTDLKNFFACSNAAAANSQAGKMDEAKTALAAKPGVSTRN